MVESNILEFVGRFQESLEFLIIFSEIDNNDSFSDLVIDFLFGVDNLGLGSYFFLQPANNCLFSS